MHRFELFGENEQTKAIPYWPGNKGILERVGKDGNAEDNSIDLQIDVDHGGAES